MSHGRPPRVKRYADNLAMMSTVSLRVSLFTPTELANVMEPTKLCLKALREGVATEDQWIELGAAVEIALSIEDKGIVRGLRGHIEQAQATLLVVYDRAMQTGKWKATALHFDELDHVSELIRLLEYQLEKTDSNEVMAAFRMACGRVLSTGSRMFKAHQLVVPGVAMAVAA